MVEAGLGWGCEFGSVVVEASLSWVGLRLRLRVEQWLKLGWVGVGG